MPGYEKMKIVKKLLTKEMTVNQIALAIGRGPRAVFRYLEVLRNENCGLQKKKKNGKTFWTIMPKEEGNFNQEIVKQLEKIKKGMKETSSSDITNRKLINKIIHALKETNPDSFKPEAITTDKDLVLDYGPFCDNKIQDSLVNKILDAIHKKLKISIGYKHSSSEDKNETFLVNPVKVLMRIDTLYLIAADKTFAKTGIYKNYLIENISNVRLTNIPMDNNLFFDASIHYKYTYGKYTDTNLSIQDVSLLIKSPWLMTQFKKSHFNPPVQFKKDKNKNDIVDMKIRITPDFKSWLMGISPDIKILKPESLKNELKKTLKQVIEEM